MILNLCEIAPGVVAFMDPEKLVEYGARCLYPDSDKFEGIHPLVCLSSNGHESVWVVLSSKSRYNRTLCVPMSSKRGHITWTGQDSFVYGFDHVWRGPNMAFQEASHRDRSTPSMRNSVVSEYLPFIRAAVNPALFDYRRTG